MKKLLITILFLLFGSFAYAQGTPGTGDTVVPLPFNVIPTLSWNYDLSDCLSCAVPSGFHISLDGLLLGTTLYQSPTIDYRFKYPTLNSGNHVLSVTAFNNDGDSAPVTISVRVAEKVNPPQAPKNLRIIEVTIQVP